jgi:hypothetical protein
MAILEKNRLVDRKRLNLKAASASGIVCGSVRE